MRPPLPTTARELFQLAADVRRIGCGLRHTPEQIAVAKDEIATRLVRLAVEADRRSARSHASQREAVR